MSERIDREEGGSGVGKAGAFYCAKIGSESREMQEERAERGDERGTGEEEEQCGTRRESCREAALKI